jgi:hypothetical protein
MSDCIRPSYGRSPKCYIHCVYTPNNGRNVLPGSLYFGWGPTLKKLSYPGVHKFSSKFSTHRYTK